MELTLERLEARECFAVDYPTTPMPEEHVSSSLELFPDTVVADAALDAKYADYNTDGISFTEMKDLLISSENDDGFYDRFEILQLKRYVRLGSLPDYVEYLAGAVVNGHFANAADATTSSLVDKWFNGKDLPEARSEYQRVQGELFVDGPSPEEAKQGVADDCYFITALGAVAQNCPEIIVNMFHEVEDRLWVVRFYDGRDKVHYVTVNDELPVSGKNRVYADFGGVDADDPNNELWAALAEKAYAQAGQNEFIRNRENAYTGINIGDSSWALKNISGQEEIRIKGASKEAHIALLAENKPITISYKHHTYTFESYDPVTDKFFLRNPYQRSHIEATWEELEALPIVSPAHGGYVFDLSPNAPIE